MAIDKQLVRWRVQGRAIRETDRGDIHELVPYIDARTAMSLLDEEDEGWSTFPGQPIIADGKFIGMIVGIRVRNTVRWDVGAATSFEPVKGAMSDGIKRAAIQHGLGRELYEMPKVYALTAKQGNSVVPVQKPTFSEETGRWSIEQPGWVWYPDEEVSPGQETARDEARRIAKQLGFNASDVAIQAAAIGLRMSDANDFTDDQWRSLIEVIVKAGLEKEQVGNSE